MFTCFGRQKHPWITGHTAKTDTLPMKSKEKLSLFRKYHSQYDAKIIHSSFSVDEDDGNDEFLPINHSSKSKQLQIMKANSIDYAVRSRRDSAPY